jgi:small subunit ribosomal protein S17
MDKKSKREIIGKVISDKTDKTITVLVETYREDSLYGKRVKYSKKYSVHDEQNVAKVGDKVSIVETRPLSKTKRFRLVKVIEKAVVL